MHLGNTFTIVIIFYKTCSSFNKNNPVEVKKRLLLLELKSIRLHPKTAALFVQMCFNFHYEFVFSHQRECLF